MLVKETTYFFLFSIIDQGFNIVPSMEVPSITDLLLDFYLFSHD